MNKVFKTLIPTNLRKSSLYSLVVGYKMVNSDKIVSITFKFTIVNNSKFVCLSLYFQTAFNLLFHSPQILPLAK